MDQNTKGRNIGGGAVAAALASGTAAFILAVFSGATLRFEAAAVALLAAAISFVGIANAVFRH